MNLTCCLYCSIASSKAAKKSVFSLSNRRICAWSWTTPSSLSPSFSFSCSWLQLSSTASWSWVIFLLLIYTYIFAANPEFLTFWLNNLFTFRHEIDWPGSFQGASLALLRHYPPWSYFQCRCQVLRQWSACSFLPPLSTATHSLSGSVLQSGLLPSAAHAAAFM